MISVVIPTFNREKYLFPTLSALFKQRVSIPYEIILVDSGTDGTKEMVKSTFPNTHYISIPEMRNRSLARNLGVENSKGEIILLLDNDMIVPPGYLQAHWEAHQMAENVVCLGKRLSLGDFNSGQLDPNLFFSQDGLKVDFMKKLPYIKDVREMDILDGVLPFEKIESTWRFCYSHGFSLSKNNFICAGGFDAKFGENWGYEDVDLGFRLAQKGVSFCLLEGYDAFHQPHDSQSFNNIDEGSINRRIFGLKYHCYEVELVAQFGPNISILLNQIAQIKKEFLNDFVPALNYKEELVFGCLYKINEEHNSEKYKMGVFISEEKVKKEAVETIRIIKGFFHFNNIIQLIILQNTLFLTRSIIFEKKDKTSLLVIKELMRDLGISIEINEFQEYFFVYVQGKNRSRFFEIILPGISEPSKRYMNYRLALLLHQNNYRVLLSDLEGKMDACYEEFSFEKEEEEILTKMKSTYYNVIERRTVVSENEYVKFSVKRFLPGSIIFQNRGYTKNKMGINNEPISYYDFIVEEKVDILNLMSAFRIVNPLLSQFDSSDLHSRTPPPSKQFLIFMLKGFVEESMETILNTFSQVVKIDPEVTLCIKVLDFPHVLKNLYKSHNRSSKKHELEMKSDEYEKNIVRLKALILDLNLRDNVFIIKRALSISDRKELYSQSLAIISVSLDNFIGIEAYEALFVNCDIIIPYHKILSTYFDNHRGIHKVNSVETPFIEARELPFNITLFDYQANEIVQESLFKIMTKVLAKEKEHYSIDMLPNFESMAMNIWEEIF